jgi:hypothetical protein
MTLKKNTRISFTRHLGKIFKDDYTTIQVYSRDMADLPKPVKIFFGNVPDGVIKVRTKEDMKKIYEVANETKTPITQRGGGTAGFGGSVPYNKGIVTDMKGLEFHYLVDPLELTVTTSPSVVFSDLQRQLKLEGFSLCAYPSSFHSATVGGWIAHGGYGVGSIQYGGAKEQIAALEVVLPTGEIKRYTEESDISLFVGSHGTLGAITEVALRIKFDIPLKHQGCTFDSPAELLNGLKHLAEIEPFSIWFLNPDHVALFNELFGYNLPRSYLAIISKEVSFEEEEQEFNTLFNNAIRSSGGQILDRRYIKDIWDFRFKGFTLIGNSPDFLVSEVILPIETSEKYFRRLVSKFKGKIHLEGEMISSTHYALLIYLLFEEKISDIKKTILNLRLYNVTTKRTRAKGKPYSTGLWFSGYYSSIYGKEQYKRYLEFKKKVDPKNISNPGKVLSPRIRFLPLVKLKPIVKLASKMML